MLRLTEIFYSIQGESTHAGRRCIFIRLAGCPLRCVWCDSEYTFTGGEKVSLEEILERISRFDCKLVEVTGGEPLVQKEAFELIRQLCDRGYEVLIETSGAYDIEPVDQRAKIILDVKCPASGESDRNLWSNLAKLREHDEVKFVIADRGDFDYALKVIAEHNLAGKTLLFSAVYGELSMQDLAEWILHSNAPARMQTQLHKHIWGKDATGV
jgi:7-carboxy-7-deazaguanine synthase